MPCQLTLAKDGDILSKKCSSTSIDAIVPKVYSQSALINMHMIRAYPLTVDSRLALHNTESDCTLLLEHVIYSFSRWWLLPIHGDRDSNWDNTLSFYTSVHHIFLILEHVSIIRHSAVSSCNELCRGAFSKRDRRSSRAYVLHHSSVLHLLPPPQAISILHPEQFGECTMKYVSFRWHILGFPSLANVLSICGNFVDGRRFGCS
ncbi:uncharacterized protein EV420DRAFT_330145 [Desarmillaria tabescens]|uniref:Uncharacterized protein n=1 Tax=Armillaria tabescens TaxID=1929756 RepID=A0AA39N661_ARMTA|nr:uncharacterized protein EV420DRAFT_330145 [Desarmillaria tabescens]KAK0458750.1 hypothetical protein EV420DRAFT_330145 [Desarmillaria tabescens]